MNPTNSPAKAVATDSPASNDPDVSNALSVCACGCGGLLKRKGQKYYSDRCRYLAFRRKEAARIADEVRAEVYEILIRKLEK